MVKDAEKFADEDKSRRDAVDTKNQACSAPPTSLLMCCYLYLVTCMHLVVSAFAHQGLILCSSQGRFSLSPLCTRLSLQCKGGGFMCALGF